MYYWSCIVWRAVKNLLCTTTTVQKHAACNTYASSTCNNTLTPFVKSNQYRFQLILHTLRPSWNVVYAAWNPPPHRVPPSQQLSARKARTKSKSTSTNPNLTLNLCYPPQLITTRLRQRQCQPYWDASRLTAGQAPSLLSRDLRLFRETLKGGTSSCPSSENWGCPRTQEYT